MPLRAGCLVAILVLAACGDAPAPREPATAPDAPVDRAAGEAGQAPPPALAGAGGQAGQARRDEAAAATDTRFDGFGPLRLGMTTREAEEAWPGLLSTAAGALQRGGCFHVPVEGLSHFALMFDGGRFVRYGGSNDAVAAPGGGRRGMAEAALRTLYHDALAERPDRFAPGGKLLSIEASGVAPSRLVFVLRPDGVVNEWRVGLRPQVDCEEGCEDAG